MFFKNFSLMLLCASIFSVQAEQLRSFTPDWSKTKSVQARLHTHEGIIVLELDFAKAPQTVANFVELSKKGFYDGTVFHRVIQRFMIQGGDPKGNGQGGPGYFIADEISDLKHEIGAVSMANRGPNTGGSQFFIVQWPQPHLDGKHTVFGRVIEGLDVVYRIEQDDPIKKIEIIEK